MKPFLLTKILLLFMLGVWAQQETYDIVTYQPPKNWKKEDHSTAAAYSRIDGGSWAQIAIYKSTASKGSVEEDSVNEWKAIVLALHAVEKEEKTEAATADGWSVISRSGVWQYNGANVAVILTTFSNGKICVSLLCNATEQPYFKDYQKLVSSIKLAGVQPHVANTNTVQGNGEVTGLWTSAVNETFGYMSGGYFRREYQFNADGTYQYRAKHWSNMIKDIQFVRETGTYTINGNSITITPLRGNGEQWSKAPNGRTEGWGSYQKALKHPLEKVTYTFERKYLSGMGRDYLILRCTQATARDGRQSNQDHTSHEFNYGQDSPDKSLIDNPPSQKNRR